MAMQFLKKWFHNGLKFPTGLSSPQGSCKCANGRVDKAINKNISK